MPLPKNAVLSAYRQLSPCASTSCSVRHEEALDRLEPLLRMPYHLLLAWLRVDPTIAPLLGYPRSQRWAGARRQL